MRRSALARIWFVSSLLALLVPAQRAAAGGLEYSAAGATALGRGGAVTARADDPMVLAYNPAGLAELRGSQILIDLNVAFMSACVDPTGYYGWGAYGGGKPSRFRDPESGSSLTLNLGDPAKLGDAEKAYYSDPLDTVCMKQHVQPIPQLAVTSRISQKLGVGFGLIFPSVTPEGQWGDAHGLIRGDDHDLRPAATRYMELNTGTIGVFPTLGAGYRINDVLRIGAAVEWGMVWVDYTTMAGVVGGTSPNNDVVAHLRARDLVVPAATLSVHLVPMDNLDIVAAFRWQDAIKASGHIDLTTSEYDPNGVPRTTNDIDVAQVKQNMPWKLRGGVRYASRLAPRPSGSGEGEGGGYGRPEVRDAFSDERWDFELDAEYQGNGVNDAQRIDYRPGQQLLTENSDGIVNGVEFPEPSKPYSVIEKHWKNQISLRAGGTYNVIPGVFGISAGTHYENRGIDPSYMQIDYWPVSRIGLHGGLTFRLFGTTDVVVSYAHIFQETIVVGAPEHADAAAIYTDYQANEPVTQIDKRVGVATSRAPQDQPQPLLEKNTSAGDGRARLTQVATRTQAGQPPWIVNSGTYRSNLDVFAIGVHTHF